MTLNRPLVNDADYRSLLMRQMAEIERIKTKRCGDSFAYFMRQAWHVLEPNQKLSWSWHHDMFCGELQDIIEVMARGEAANDLTVNVPPGTTKSLTLVFWNAWVWGPRRMAHLGFLCASFGQNLASRDNQRVRDLITSAWFQERWPHVKLRDDQNQKTKFGTTDGGWRIGTSVGAQASMGEHPHIKVLDDAHNPENVPGEVERDGTWHWFENTFSQRGYGLKAVTVAAGQRLHEDDVFGRIRAKLKGWTHIVLPMRYDPPALVDGVLTPRMEPTPAGRNDVRTVAGELLWPKHLTAAVVEKAQAVLGGEGSEGVSAQHQQQPIKPGGNMFMRTWFNIIDVMPLDVVWTVRFWDVAGTEGGTGAETAGSKMSSTRSGRYVISNVIHERFDDDEVDTLIKQTARLDGPAVSVREEKEGGSAGLAVTNARARSLPGFDYDGVRPVGEKPVRARALRTQAKAGNVDILVRSDADRTWAEYALAQLAGFPSATLKDVVDSLSGAFNVLVNEDPPKPPEQKTAGVWGSARASTSNR